MTIQQLQYLLEVYKAGSFSLAAEKLYITQSAISNAVISLEKEIGAPIFIRGRNKLVTTPRGEDVIRHAQRACENIEQISVSNKDWKKSVRVGSVSFSPAHNAFMRLLEENRGREDVEFSFTDTSTGDFLKRLQNYELDIVLFFNITSYTMGRLERVKNSDLHHEILCTSPAMISLSPKHPLYNKPQIEPQDLSKYKMLVNSAGGLANVRTLGAYLPIRNNLIYVDGHRLRQRVLDEGHAFSVARKPMRDERIENRRYIPVKGMSYTIYYVTNPKYPHAEELDRYIELLKEEVKLQSEY